MPEMDATPELSTAYSIYFQSFIGIIRWSVDLEHIDITCEVSMISYHIEISREGHLQQVYGIFGYLRQNHNSRFLETCLW